MLPRHDHERCLACGGCTYACPASFFPDLREEEDSLRGALYRDGAYAGEVRTVPPCQQACPLGQDVPAYISAIAAGDLARAARVVRKTNPLPRVLGRICIAACIGACTRASMDAGDAGLDIRGLKRRAVEGVEIDLGIPSVDSTRPVAIIGSGPAGLGAAVAVLEQGMQPVVFESAAIPGGMLAQAIPDFLLPPAALAADVADLSARGVEFRTRMAVGRDISVEDLEKDFIGIVAATGAPIGWMPKIPGRSLAGVITAVNFCEQKKRNRDRVPGPVVISGMNRASILAARIAVRLSDGPVMVLGPLPLSDWSAGGEEIDLAAEEGVAFLPEHSLVGFAGEAGLLTGALVRQTVAGGEDRVHRVGYRSRGKSLTMPAALCIVGGLRRPASDDLLIPSGADRGILGTLLVDGEYRLGRSGWYGAGELVTGSATVVDALATGLAAGQALGRDILSGRGTGR